ncbi:MAG: phosphatase PAP2 family protein, partial [Nodosilinea sp.]
MAPYSAPPSITRWGIALPLAATTALLALGLLVAAYPALPAWDSALLLGLHQYATPALNRAIALFTDLGTVWGVLPATLGLAAIALWHRRWLVASYWIGALAGSIVLNPAAKALWQRVRPALWEGVPPQSDFSFPSGHATYSMTFVLALVLLSWA